MRISHAADTMIARILFVTPQPEASVAAAPTRLANRAFSAALLFSALRCTVQYVILPFVPPLIGMAARPSIGVVIALDLIALISLVTSLRRFWQVRHPRRWDYLLLALAVVFTIVAFLVYDILALRA